MIFDQYLSKEEIEEIKQNIRGNLRIWRKRTLYSTVALLLSCACVYPFVDGHQISSYGEILKRKLLLLCLALLVVSAFCAYCWWYDWYELRDVEKLYP